MHYKPLDEDFIKNGLISSCGCAIIVLANNKKLMGEYRISKVGNAIGIAAIFWVFYLSYSQIMSFITG